MIYILICKYDIIDENPYNEKTIDVMHIIWVVFELQN